MDHRLNNPATMIQLSLNQASGIRDYPAPRKTADDFLAKTLSKVE